jgi:hypothetical protein
MAYNKARILGPMGDVADETAEGFDEAWHCRWMCGCGALRKGSRSFLKESTKELLSVLALLKATPAR